MTPWPPIVAIATLCFTVSAVSVASSLSHCVLHDDGRKICRRPTELHPAARVAGAPCDRKDMKCWCAKAVKYTNDHRRNRGMTKTFKSGPMRQLDNAIRYAGVIAGLGRLEHQNLADATRDVQCGRYVGGENIAYNYETGDVARACVDQWIASKGHRENMEREWFDESVVGFHFTSDGRVYCVQTFAILNQNGAIGDANASGCEPAANDAGGPTGTTPVSPTEAENIVEEGKEEEFEPPAEEYIETENSVEDPVIMQEGARGGRAAPTSKAEYVPVNSSSSESESGAGSGSEANYVHSTGADADSGSGYNAPHVTGMERRDPKLILSTSMPDMIEKLLPPKRRQGNRSCRCLEVGPKCWHSLRIKSGYHCKPKTEREAQPMACKRKCCGYCKRHPTDGRCINAIVKALCEAL